MNRDKNENDMSNIALAYCRKSEEDKKRQVLSLNDQVNECNKLIKDYSLNLIVPHFKEEKSGRKAGVRTEFYRMLNLLKAGKAKVVVCWNANRLARNMIDGSEIIDLVQHKGLRIITPYTQYDLSNWFMLLIEFGMSTDFSLKLSKDVKRGLESKVAKGIKPGLAPIGYLNVGEVKGEKTVTNDPERFDLVKRWWQMILTGQYTVDESLAAITKLGLRDRRGNPVSRTASFSLFHNVFYAGYFNFQGEVHKGIQEPVVTLEEFNKAQKIITGKFSGRYIDRTEIRTLPLSGFIKCGECSSTITSERKTKTYKNGTSREYFWYRCKKNKGVCTQRSYTPADDLEGQVRTFISNLELNPRFIDWVRKVLKRRNRDEFEFEHKNKEVLTKRLHEIDGSKEKLFSMKIDGLYSEDEYKQKKAAILKEEADIKEQLNSDRISYWEQMIDNTLEFAGNILELFNTGDDYTKRMVLQILGSDLKLKDKKLYLEAKSVFMFLRNKQNELSEENGLVGLKKGPSHQSNQAEYDPSIHFGAADRI